LVALVFHTGRPEIARLIEELARAAVRREDRHAIKTASGEARQVDGDQQ